MEPYKFILNGIILLATFTVEAAMNDEAPFTLLGIGIILILGIDEICRVINKNK
jgi:hypothetical protein